VSKNLGIRAGIVALVVIGALIYLVPSLSRNLPPWWSNVLPKDKIHLGLDLQGGIHLNLEVEAIKAVESNVERVSEELKHDLRKNKIRYLELKSLGKDGIVLKLMRSEDVNSFLDMFRGNYPDFDPGTATYEEGKPVFHVTVLPKARERIMKMAVDQALETIRNRIDQFGVSEPDIRPAEGHRIIIELPGIKDPKRAIALIGKTALLEFKLVDEDHSVEEALKGRIPPGDEILYETSVDQKTGQRSRVPYLLEKRTLLTGEYITDARVEIDSRYNEPYVSLSFDSRGARLFEQITGQNIKKRLAIVLDNKVYSAPVIQDKISGGRAQITGRFSMQEARHRAQGRRSARPGKDPGRKNGRAFPWQGLHTGRVSVGDHRRRSGRSFHGGLLQSERHYRRHRSYVEHRPDHVGACLFRRYPYTAGHRRNHPDHWYVR
jgi:preprotein translocase subunit SecD